MNDPIPQTEDEIKAQIFAFICDTFKNPAELLAFIDDDLNNGTYTLHEWQKRIHIDTFGKQYVSTAPLDLCIRAVNGSGKDEKVIAPAALFLIATNRAARVVITSASARQVADQTEKYISRFGNEFNKKLTRLFGLGDKVVEFFIVQKRKIVCTFADNSEILLFATDEPGQAEGYHPMKAGGVFAMIINEAKNITQEMWMAFLRCNGYTHWIEVSSPGKQDGHFYDKSTSINPRIVQYVVTADDCPHLGGQIYRDTILAEVKSEEHPYYRGVINCEFTISDGELLVIDAYKYNRLIKFQHLCEHHKSVNNNAGLDLAFGGDEICLQVRNGNKHIGAEYLKSKDTLHICLTIVKWLQKWDLYNTPGKIYTDAGGLGDVIISLLQKQYGIRNIVRMQNNWPSSNETAYSNLGAEMWFSFEKLVEAQEIIIQNEDVLKNQLCNRHYKINLDTSCQLESKPQARSKGRKSPDRADALVLCFHNYKSKRVTKEREEKKAEYDKLRSTNNWRPTIENIIKKRMNSDLAKLGFNKPIIKNDTKNDLQRELDRNFKLAMERN